MKRIHLFEFEDFSWFPGWLRVCMTRYMVVIHKLLDSAPTIASHLDKSLRRTSLHRILDLCSGSGGPMEEVVQILRSQYGYQDLQLIFSDLYPDSLVIHRIRNLRDPALTYSATPIDATRVNPEERGLLTMICSMHHLKPAVAIHILRNAAGNNQPLFVYEISDNGYPKWLWWMAIPVNLIMVLLLTPMVRPITWQQLVFTYILPLLPLVIAWDGAVSNVRTYTLKDLDLLLNGLYTEKYTWEKGLIKGKAGPKLYLRGIPQN